ncbi:hypothetical protein BGY98DRAFT_1104080 [Russula aff. rugulosa BPL654]|nr:hypothetical protein BGY98DRAFT_1104080 [Russula aff. rugulosa BPL654]
MDIELVETTPSPLAIVSVPVMTGPSTSQFNEKFDLASNNFKKLLGQRDPTKFESPEAVFKAIDETVQQFNDFRAGNHSLKTWLESYVDLLFRVSEKLWESKSTEAPPSPEKMICNAIVILIETAFEVEESYKKLVDFFDSHQFHLQRVYESEFSNTAEIKLLLLTLMAEALSNMVDYIKAMKQRPMKKVLKVLARKKDINRIRTPHRLLHSRTNEDALLSVSKSAATPTGEKLIRDTNDMIRGVGHKASQVEAKDLPDKLRQWLSPPNPLNDLVDAHPGAGKWFIQSKTFRWWKKKEKGASLLICGETGSGKTTLCSSIIEELNRTRSKSEIIVCYYFDSEKPDKRNFRGLLASLVTQLCKGSNRHPESIPVLYTKCRNGSDPPTEADLTQLLNRFLTKLQAQFWIYIVIDGVDNCIDAESTEFPRKKVLKFLEDLIRSRHSKLNICITSSLKEDMEKSLKPLAAGASSRQVILHEEKGQKEEIENYIAAFVRRHMQVSPEDKEHVIKKLSERAGGIFGWITHRLNTLLEKIPSQTSDILEKVGTPQDEKFTQALRDIPEEKYQYAFHLFQCLVAAIRPLSLKELADISAELDSNAGPHEDAVLSACPTLIARDKDDPTIVQFSHESVKEFLASSRLQTSSPEKNTSRYHFSPEAAHTTLARVCINVLLRFDDTAVKTQLMEKFPLALYAAQHWVEHTQQGNAATENQGVMESLFDPNKSHLEAWIWMHDVDKGQSRTMENLPEHPPERSGTPLYYASLCGFAELVKHLASLRAEDLHDSRGFYGTPLHAASYKGHYDTVLALLESDSKMNEKADNRTPLHAAYYGEQVKIIELLLEKGAEVDAKGILDNTLLHCASLDGRRDVVELLLKNEAGINAKNKNGWTPLHRAALRGRLEVAECLLNFKPKDENDEKLDVNVQSYNKNTPLHVAAITGKLQMVELLLRYNAARGINGEHGWTPLEAAEKNRHEKIVERLSGGWWADSDLRRGVRQVAGLAKGLAAISSSGITQEVVLV